MGAGQSVVDRAGQLRIYEYPYGWQKLTQFPYKHFWTNSILCRCFVAGLIISWPIALSITRAVNSPANKAEWKEKRIARRHTHFDPPQPVEYPAQPPHWW